MCNIVERIIDKYITINSHEILSSPPNLHCFYIFYLFFINYIVLLLYVS